MGKAKGPAFVDNLTKASPVKKQNLPMLLLIVAGGVGILWILRSKSNFAANTAGSTTNPAVSINGGNAPDQSTIDNLTASVLALQGLQSNNSSIPSGGASTPITTQPVATTPAAAVANTPNTPAFTTPAANNAYGTTVGPVFTGNQNPVLSPAMSASLPTAGGGAFGGGINTLTDWYKYQYTKVAAARQGTVINDATMIASSGQTPAQYLQSTLGGGNPSFYGPNAGPAQAAEQAAASAAAKKQLGIA
jgi:hypothetical protein